jgi:hypothetical protein
MMMSKENVLFALIFLTLLYLVFKVNYSIPNELSDIKIRTNKNVTLFSKSIQNIENKFVEQSKFVNAINNGLNLLKKK